MCVVNPSSNALHNMEGHAQINDHGNQFNNTPTYSCTQAGENYSAKFLVCNANELKNNLWELYSKWR